MTIAAFADELTQIGAHRALLKVAAYKGHHGMPKPTKANVNAMMNDIEEWDSPNKEKALELANEISPPKLFEVIHGMRRWYSGGTMQKKLIANHDELTKVMDLNPEHAVGVYRGFKVSNKDPLAKVQPGDRFTLPVTRNNNVSSWSMDEKIPNRFSGGGKGKTGLIVKLVDAKGIKPILAPPAKTEDWFNELYEQTIGKSFRPNESEYLIEAPEVEVEVVRVKK